MMHTNPQFSGIMVHLDRTREQSPRSRFALFRPMLPQLGSISVFDSKKSEDYVLGADEVHFFYHYRQPLGGLYHLRETSIKLPEIKTLAEEMDAALAQGQPLSPEIIKERVRVIVEKLIEMNTTSRFSPQRLIESLKSYKSYLSTGRPKLKEKDLALALQGMRNALSQSSFEPQYMEEDKTDLSYYMLVRGDK